ncbi:phospholipase D-like protein [Actinomadura hallensis]|uniref:Phospholipase D-like protein n=1 Tax=Actinomadura hallensis TaxID=337895 RepID=A0A543IMF5_9ACTN|nr:PLD nuclease N-terminal domain-containing protein [Actinomadura hallensis]TQM71766.1 phospholipase D-like protein [Actinomadura hallensis]HLV74988.1 PLD nuclease N-terminal domain-containing protein [Vulgatibacteraceae bacterium]
MIHVLVVLLLLAIWLYCLLDVLRTDESELKHLSKRAWFAVAFFGFLIGSVLWLLEGRNRRSRVHSGAPQMPPPPAGGRPVGPDDDPEFLRELERRLREGDA